MNYEDSQNKEDEIIMHSIYLPFNEKQLLSHFSDVKKNSSGINNQKHLKYYRNSIQKYNKYLLNNPDRDNKS